MSWGEVFKINSNLKKPLNEQMKDLTMIPMRIFAANATYVPEKTGTYRVICIGQGGDGYASTGTTYRGGAGAGGGVAIKTMKLTAGTSYNITANQTASFGTTLTATAGSGSSDGGTGGTATGGDYNYPGTPGVGNPQTYTADTPGVGGSVGVAIVGLTHRSQVSKTFTDGESFDLIYGNSLLGYGGGGSGVVHHLDGSTSSSNRVSYKTSGLPAAVIIIPIELEG